MRPSPIDLLLDSLRISSTSGEEGEFAAFLMEMMRSLGYRNVRSDSAGNVQGETGSGGRSLLLCGHMDTVPGALPVVRSKGRILGRGAADAKGALCSLLLAGAQAHDCGVKLTFAGVTREESDSLGIMTLIGSGQTFDYAIFGEPGGANKITMGYRGRVTLRVVLESPGGHSGSDWLHQNPIQEFLKVDASLKELEQGRTVQGDHFRSLSVVPTMISAGTADNVVPDRCDATFDVRLPPGLKSSEAIGLIREAISSAAIDARVSIEFGDATEAYSASPSSPIVRALQRGILLTLKTRPTMVKKTGTGDMNTMSSSTSTQCVTYGPGDASTSHSSNEQMEEKDYLNSIRVLEATIRQLAILEPG